MIKSLSHYNLLVILLYTIIKLSSLTLAPSLSLFHSVASCGGVCFQRTRPSEDVLNFTVKHVIVTVKTYSLVVPERVARVTSWVLLGDRSSSSFNSHPNSHLTHSSLLVFFFVGLSLTYILFPRGFLSGIFTFIYTYLPTIIQTRNIDLKSFYPPPTTDSVFVFLFASPIWKCFIGR